MFYPLVVAIVAAAFAGAVWRQYAGRRKPYQFVWGLSLSTGAIAGLAFLLFLGLDRNVVFFKVYYVCGAVLMAALLGLGSVYLLAPRRVADGVACAVGAVAVIGSLLIMTASVPAAQLHRPDIEAGTKLITGIPVLFIVVLNTFGAVAVVGGAIYSGWQVRRRRGPGALVLANSLIAVGTILASLAGTLARVTGSGSAFWLLLAAGFIILFAGFTVASRSSAIARPGSSPSVAADGGI